MRWQPTLRVAAPYYDEPAYIDALAASIAERAGAARFRAGGHSRLLPRHPAGLFRQGRPLLSAIARRRRGSCARRSGCDEKRLRMTLPVALRPRGMAEALYGRDRQGAGARRRQAPGRRHARLRRRLPGDAGGDRRRERRIFPRRGRREIRGDPLPQRFRRGPRGPGDGGAAGAVGMGVGAVTSSFRSAPSPPPGSSPCGR